MNTKYMALIPLVIAVLALAGCKKEEPITTPSDTGMKSATEATTDAATQAAAAAKSAATEVKQAAEEAKTTLGKAAETASTEAQGFIDQAKAYVKDQKYQDALAVVQKLGNLKLTAEQQQIVNDLKTQIQNYLAKKTGADAASALGGALGGKK